MKSSKKHSLRIVRLIFTGLLLFEFLNWVEILPVKVEFSWLGLIITGGTVFTILEILEHRLKKYHGIELPASAFIIGLIPVLYDASGDIFHWYGRFDWYDQIAHFLGSSMAAAIVFIFFRTLHRAEHINWTLGTRAFFAFTTAVTFGVLYELEEFGEDVLTCYHGDLIPFLVEKLLPCGQRFGDAYDTGTDLFFDFLGGGAAVLTAWAFIAYRRKRAAKLS